jgi:alkylation response protein AidB-like acyl-CoA dehydrogenase
MSKGHSQKDGISFNESDELRLIKSQIDEFIEQEVKPLEKEHDRFLGENAELTRLDDDGTLVDDYLNVRKTIRKKSAEAGFFDMAMPEDVGGGGLSLLEYLQVVEHINNRHPEGFHEMMLGYAVNPSFLMLLHDGGYLQDAYFRPLLDADKTVTLGLTEPEHGTDATWMDAEAERDGDKWIINGTKCFTSGSTFADCIIVIARTSGETGDASGISAFMIDRDNPGWEVGKIQRPMSKEDAGRLAFNHFTDCQVPEEHLIGNEGEAFIDIAIQTVGFARLLIPARAVGRAQWMFDECVEYAKDRKTFGKPIGKRQFVKGMLSELRADIEQVRWLYRHAAWKYDRDEGERWEQSVAKLRGSELWNDAADTAVQIHGGAGYMRSLPFEAEYRNARATRIYDGANELHREIIADQFLNL